MTAHTQLRWLLPISQVILALVYSGSVAHSTVFGQSELASAEPKKFFSSALTQWHPWNRFPNGEEHERGSSFHVWVASRLKAFPSPVSVSRACG
jgi:hypothetical protein